MALVLGSATVDDDGIVTKSGMVARYYDAIVANLTVTIPGGHAGVPFLRQIAAQATAHADALHKVLTIDARARIGADGGGDLQRLPSSLTTGEPTDPPAVDKFLPIV